MVTLIIYHNIFGIPNIIYWSSYNLYVEHIWKIGRHGESKRRDMHGHRKSDGHVSSYNVLWKAAGRGVQSGAGIFPNVENLCSRFRSDSDVSRISAAAGVKPVTVSSLCRDVCRCSLREAAFTGGIFDPTVGALTSLWNIGGENERIPSEEEIEGKGPH